MKYRLTLWVDRELKRDFENICQRKISPFLEELMREYIREMQLQGFIACQKCNIQSHIRAILYKNGLCPMEDCKHPIITKTKVDTI